jgi:hypothetical protein
VSYSLNNVPTADVFPTSTGPVLRCPGTVRLRVHVDNAGVLWQYGRGIAPAPQFDAPPATLLPGIYSLEQRVDNAGVLWQFAEADPTPRWDEHPEATLLPGVYSLDQSCDAVRFRSLAAGKPAQVSVQALVEGE